jgi:hypothetical protein
MELVPRHNPLNIYRPNKKAPETILLLILAPQSLQKLELVQ